MFFISLLCCCLHFLLEAIAVAVAAAAAASLAGTIAEAARSCSLCCAYSVVCLYLHVVEPGDLLNA